MLCPMYDNESNNTCDVHQLCSNRMQNKNVMKKSSERFNDPAQGTWSTSSPQAASSVENWCDDNTRYKPQGNSMAVEMLLLIGSATVVSFIFYNPRESDIISPSLYFALFALGALLYQFLRPILTRKVYRQSQIVMFYIAAAIFLIWPNNNYAITCGRAFTGFGTGLVYVEYLYKVAEVAHQNFRGMLAGCGGMLYLGMMMHGTAISPIEDEHFSSYRYIGCMVLLYAVIAQVFIFIFVIESPVYHLQHGDYAEATRSMMRLRTERSITWEIQQDIKDFSDMLQEDEALDRNIFSQRNFKPLFVVLATRVISVLMVNFPFTALRARIADEVLTATDQDTGVPYAFGGLVLTSARLFSTLLLLFIIDSAGRRKVLMFSTMCSSMFALVMGGFMFFEVNPTVLLIICIIYELLASVGFSGVCDIYTSEAFPTTKKALSIGFVLAMEQILQIILLIVFQTTRNTENFDNYLNYWYIPLITGGLVMIIGITSWINLWETKQVTYRETRRRLRS